MALMTKASGGTVRHQPPEMGNKIVCVPQMEEEKEGMGHVDAQ